LTMKLVLISGWAHGSEAMAPLAGLLSSRWCTECMSLDEFRFGPGPQTEPTVLIGWSTGAIAALQVAAEQAPYVAGVVTIGGTARFCACEDYPCGVPPANLRAMAIGLRRRPEETLGRFFADCASPRALDEDVLAERVRHARGLIAPAVLSAGLSFLAEADVRHGLREVDIPLLALHGMEDRIVPVSASEYLVANSADARLVKLPGIGHAVPEQVAESATATIADYLERL